MHLLHIQKKRPIHYAIILGLAVFLIPVVSYAFTAQVNTFLMGGGSVFQGIGQAILSMVGVLTGFGGWILNYSMYHVVIEMGSTLRNSGIDNQIGVIWSVIRDIANIAFVFGLIFIGFQTILNIETINTKKTLVAIIVGALLINFSLFFTKIVIDISNLFAVEVYELFEVPDTEERFTYGIAGSFMQAMGMNTFFSGINFGDLTTFNVTARGNIAFFFMAMIFLLIAAFVFLAGAVLLIIRFVALLLIMMFSPIMFAGMVFPQTQAAARGLWSKLLSYSFFAPIYLFLLLISLLILDQTRDFFSGSFSDAFANANVGAFPIILNFTIGAVLLIASLIIAKNLSIVGADRTIGIGKSLAKAWPTYTGARALNRIGARYLSKKVRQFEMGEESTLTGRLGGSAFGEGLKKVPFVRPGFQQAGQRAKHDIEGFQNKYQQLGLRTSQAKKRLRDPARRYTPSDKLSLYKYIHENKGDVDELNPEEVIEYYNLLKSHGMGTLALEKARPDVLYEYLTQNYEQQRAEASARGEVPPPPPTNPVLKMKTASEVSPANLHKVTASRSGDGTEGISADARNSQIGALHAGFIKYANGEILSGLARRGDDVTEEYVEQLSQYLRSQKDERGKQLLGDNEDITAQHIVAHYKRMAKETQQELEDAKAQIEGDSEKARKQRADLEAKYKDIQRRQVSAARQAATAPFQRFLFAGTKMGNDSDGDISDIADFGSDDAGQPR